MTLRYEVVHDKNLQIFFPRKSIENHNRMDSTRGISRKGEVGVVTEILGPTVLHLLHCQEFRF